MINFTSILFLFLTIACSSAFSGSLEKKIEQFILKNPEVILESLKNYEQKKEEEIQKESIIKIKNNMDLLLDDSNGLYSGNKNSDRTIIKFFDYNCSYCRKAHKDIDKVIEKEKIKVIYKNFPILSDNSVYLAKLGMLAAEKSVKSFNKFYKFINESNGKIDKKKIKKITEELDIDLEELNNPITKNRIEKKLKNDVDLANELGLRGTPAFVVGEEIIFGYVEVKELLKKIN